MMIINLNGQQWIDDSCNKKASKIVNKAIDHLSTAKNKLKINIVL